MPNIDTLHWLLVRDDPQIKIWVLHQLHYVLQTSGDKTKELLESSAARLRNSSIVSDENKPTAEKTEAHQAR